MARLFALALAFCLPALALAQSAPVDHEQAVARLQARLQELETDPSLADLAGLERLQARQAVVAARDAKRRDRDLRLALAGIRIDAARAAAETELFREQADELDRERDQLLIEASRREAEQARRQADRLELQRLAREEAAERQTEATTVALEAAGAETAQARKLAQARARETELARKEAELVAAVAADDITDAVPPPMRPRGGARVYTLAGSAFGSGSAILTAPAQASLRALAAELRDGSRGILIQGHTDSQGADSANLALSRKRAEAVRRVLEDAGLPGGRLEAGGLGETEPVADNESEDGRARNRRVEIIVN